VSYALDYINQAANLLWNANQFTWAGQTFKAPDSSNTVLDKFEYKLYNGTNATTYTGFLYEWGGSSVSGLALASKSTATTNGSNTSSVVTFDIPDYELNPLKQYIFYVYGEGIGGVLVSANTDIYSQGTIWNYDVANTTWVSRNQTAGFAAYFLSPQRTGVGGLSMPTGNFNEQTNIAINLSGTFGGTGTFDIANPQQSGNNDVKAGKYGSLTVNQNGEFFYSVSFDKVDALNTGDNPVDEFTINLTSPTGAVSSATYRVQIEGYTDPTPGPGPTPKDKSITITGNRGTVSGKLGIIVDGDTTGFDPGTKLVPYVRFPGQTQYTEGSARPEVGADGGFTWQRKTGKKTYVYFKNEAESIQSNRVIVPAAFKNVAGGALSDAGLDPIISGGTSPFHKGHSEAKAKRNRRSSGFSLVDSEANTAAFGGQLMAADPFSANIVGVDSGLFPVASGDII
jgi:VCBS repeat-containing protein